MSSIKFGDTKLVGFLAFAEGGSSGIIPVEPPIVLIKAHELNLLNSEQKPEEGDARDDDQGG